MRYEVKDEADDIIQEIYRQGNPNRGMLSNLRRSATITDLRDQDVLQVFMRHLDKEQLSKDGKPTIVETAIYTAVHFYAIYQSGQDQPLYANSRGKKPGIQLLEAFAALKKHEVNSHVGALLQANNIAHVINEFSYVIRQFKSGDQMTKIDFAQLAQDFCDFQRDYKHAGWVRLRWGQLYFYEKPSSEKKGK